MFLSSTGDSTFSISILLSIEDGILLSTEDKMFWAYIFQYIILKCTEDSIFSKIFCYTEDSTL